MTGRKVTMTDEPVHQPYEWADQLFSNRYDIDPKYRDMLAMMAATMMGNPGAAQHFYNQALVDGASDDELNRVVQIARSSMLDVGNLTDNVNRVVSEAKSVERRAEQDEGNGAKVNDADSNPN
jgi:hypothetical protein